MKNIALDRLVLLINEYKQGGGGRTQKSLAEEMGIDPNYLSRIRRGLYSESIPEKQARKISDFFRVRYEWLMGLDDYRTDQDVSTATILLNLAEKKIEADDAARKGIISIMMRNYIMKPHKDGEYVLIDVETGTEYYWSVNEFDRLCIMCEGEVYGFIKEYLFVRGGR